MAGILWTLIAFSVVYLALNIELLSKVRRAKLADIPSSLWLALIVAGAVLAAVGNVGFNVAREREKGEMASAKAMRMLRSEIVRNLGRITMLRKNVQAGLIDSASLETTAWTVVSTSGLLSQMDQQTLAEVTDAYHLLNQAEAYRSEVLSRSIGITQALGGAEVITQQMMGYLVSTLDQLEPKLQALATKPQS